MRKGQNIHLGAQVHLDSEPSHGVQSEIGKAPRDAGSPRACKDGSHEGRQQCQTSLVDSAKKDKQLRRGPTPGNVLLKAVDAARELCAMGGPAEYAAHQSNVQVSGHQHYREPRWARAERRR